MKVRLNGDLAGSFNSAGAFLDARLLDFVAQFFDRNIDIASEVAHMEFGCTLVKSGQLGNVGA